MLGPDTIKAIETHKRNERLAEIGRKQRAYQIKLLVRDGYGREDLMQPQDDEAPRPWKLGLSYAEASEAVFGRGK
jgi:hypothetical protein